MISNAARYACDLRAANRRRARIRAAFHFLAELATLTAAMVAAAVWFVFLAAILN